MRNKFRIAIIFFFLFTFFFFNSRAQAVTDYFLPLFYIPQNIIYTNLDTKNLLDILGFEDYKIRSGIYLDENGNWKMENGKLINRTDEIFVKGELENVIKEELGVVYPEAIFPFVSQKPGSFFYPLVLKKELLEEWTLRNDPEKLVDKKLYYAGKRISEFEKFGVENVDKEMTVRILKEYQKKMEETVKEIEKLKDLDKQEIKWLRDLSIMKLRENKEKHEEKIEEIYQNRLEYVPSDNDWERVFDELDVEIKTLEKPFDLKNLTYSYKIPKKGTYSIFTGNINGLINLEMNGNTTEINKDKIETNGGWIKLGEREFEEGNNQLVVHLPEPDNLVGTSWQKFEETKVKEGGVEFTQNPFPNVINLVFQEINNWQPDNLYSVSFDYTTKVSHLGMGILESKIESQEGNDIVKKEKVLGKILRNGNDDEWKTFETILRADKKTLGAKIYFYTPANSNNSGKVEFKNLKVARIYRPEIILRNDTGNQILDTKRITPKITFVKINPTKYRVKIEGAVNPYTLVFSESFNQGWKAYINEIPNSKFQILNGYGEIVASYFDGDIKEGTHRNIFLDTNTFETWNKKPIPEERHLLVNGYANSWYITPDDAGGKGNYEIIIEFWPQRLFYVGLGITLFTLFGCFGYLGYSFIKRKIVTKNEKH